MSTLPEPALSDRERQQIRVKPRYLRDPGGLQRLKDSLREAPLGPLVSEETAEAPSVAASRLSVVSAFEGLADIPDNAIAGVAASPSDANLAVGPSHVFEMVNVVGRISNKAGEPISTFTLRSFFQLDPAADQSDPSVIYDAATDRWFATYLQFSNAQSSVVLAVSTTGDPTGTFCRFRLGNPTSEAFLQDFPHIGTSDDKVIVTYNAFTFVKPELFLGAGYHVINKADLITSGCPSSVRRVRILPDPTRYGVYPAQALSSSGALYMAMNAGPIHGNGSTVVVFAVNGVPGVGPVTEDSFVVSVRSWLTPPDAEQAGSPVRVNTNDESVITAVWQSGGLWIGGNEQCVPSGDVGPGPRSCLRLIQIQTDVGSVRQDITLGAPGQYYYFPAVSPDGAGNLFVVFNASSATASVGVRATGRLTTDPLNTLVAPTLLRPGDGAQTTRRMGDFYGAALDPADPSKVWVTAEYTRSSSTIAPDWGTFVAQLTFGPPPTIVVSLNRHAFTTGERLKLDLTVGNPAAALFVDIYLGALLPSSAGPPLGCPMGDAIAFVTGSATVGIRCLSASPASFPKFVAAGTIAAGQSTFANYFSFLWPPAPAGPYTIFVVFAVPGALDDGSIGPSDLIAIGSDTLIFSP